MNDIPVDGPVIPLNTDEVKKVEFSPETKSLTCFRRSIIRRTCRMLISLSSLMVLTWRPIRKTLYHCKSLTRE